MVRCLSGGSRLFGPEGGLWGAALNMQSCPSPTEPLRGLGILWIACIDTARVVALSLPTCVPRCTLYGVARPRLEAAS